MSEHHTPEHTSPIKTPKQLIIVVLLSFIVPITLIITLAHLAIDSAHKPAAPAEAVAERIKPAGEVVVAAAGGAQETRNGKAVYEAVCMACHASGVLNAPKFGDKGAWAKLIAEGQAQLTADAMKGVRQMPPRGGSPDLSDTEFARAVAYMAAAAGANWKEPEAPAAPKPGAVPVDAMPAAAAPAPTPAAVAGGDVAKGKSIYDATCMACHASGVAGAPKAGDKAAWAPRLKTGKDALYNAALKGMGAMPPKGGNASLSDADVKATVDYMIGLVK